MTVFRDHLSAWLLVAVLGGTLIAAGELDRAAGGGGDACLAPAAHATGVDLPRGERWAPDASLAGLPEPADGLAAYEVAEAAALSRHGAEPAPVRQAARLEPGASLAC